MTASWSVPLENRKKAVGILRAAMQRTNGLNISIVANWPEAMLKVLLNAPSEKHNHNPSPLHPGPQSRGFHVQTPFLALCNATFDLYGVCLPLTLSSIGANSSRAWRPAHPSTCPSNRLDHGRTVARYRHGIPGHCQSA